MIIHSTSPQQSSTNYCGLSRNSQMYEQTIDYNMTKNRNYGVYKRFQLGKTNFRPPTF